MKRTDAWLRLAWKGDELLRPLSDYLEVTAEDPRPASERLRSLAIRLEEEGAGWRVLDEIYRVAHQEAPGDPKVLRSWGISAHERLSGTPEDAEVAEAGLRALHEAHRLAPDDAETAYVIGLIHYDSQGLSNAGKLAEARAWFSRAVERDPEHRMAQLYLAHCLHDAQQWAEAARAYEAVDLEALARSWPAWRAIKAKEQLACCLAFSGQPEAARDHLRQLFDALETMDDEALADVVMNLDEAVDALSGPLHDPDLVARVLALAQRIGMADQYPQLSPTPLPPSGSAR